MGFQNYVLVALVAGAVAGPINVEDGNQKCARTCTESLSENAKFQYAVGTTYQFTYAGEAVTQVEGSGQDSSALKISATADVEVLSQCEFSLKLRDVRLLENGQTSSSSASFGQRLEASALRFSFQDGRIESVCPDASEDDRVLNLKKGVLSAFQNSLATMESSATVQEEDVTGTCDATYVVERGVLGGYTVKKSKDLLSCTNRNGNISSLQSESYRVPSSVQSLPLMRSTHSCEQKISSGVLQSASCKEEHVFRPFSKHNSGAKTVVESSLKLDRTRQGVSTRLEPVQRRTSLLFQHTYDSGIDANARDNVVAILTTLCDQVKVGIRPETPEEFGRLVQAMKKLSLESMVDVRNRLTSGHVCSSGRATKFFLDAVPLVGTAASVAFTRDLIKDGTITGAEIDAWLTQLAFVQQPTVQMLAEIKPLLEDSNLRNKAVLGVSSLMHKVCSSMAACQRHPDVAAVVRAIEAMLGSNCNVNDAEDRTRIMYALKAVGNAGRAVTSSSIISACSLNANVDVDIRVAALQAFRRLPCSVDREAAMRLFQKADEDAELRINAYLAVMTCPSSESLLKVKMALSGEVVNQVGSFVWTHLTNLQETSSVFKQDIRNILQDAKLREDYDCDARKYSHNYEKSFFSEYLNMGGQVESNVIFSQKSYVPRSAMLNLTVDMFGNSINLLEVGGRVQGLETILEKFFGKNGYFSQSNSKSLMRNKRDVNHNLASIFDKIFKIRDDKLRGGLYLKALGNELFYKEMTQETFAQGNVNFLDLLMKLAEPTDMELTHSSMFLDTTLVMPTMIGMPLNLTVNGTAMLNLQIGGKADIRKAATSPRSLDISGHVKPSAAIVISGTMSVHGLTAQSTLRLVSTMHTSTAVEGKLQLQDGEVLNAELKVPRDKTEVVSIESKILINGVELQAPAEGRTEVKKCSSQWLSKVTGMELCAEASIPPLAREGSAYFPLTGPLSAKVFVNQKDRTSAYTFEARYQSPRVRQDGVDYVKRLARFSFDTPGSAVDRKMALEFSFDQQKMAAGLSFITPWKKLSADSELVNLDSIKKATVRLTVDGEKYYSGLAEMSVDAKKSKVVYSPRIEINIPGREMMTAAGTLELNNNWPMKVEVTIDKFTTQPIKLTGMMSKPGDSITGSASIISQWASVKVDGGIDNKKGLQGARLSAEYSFAPGSSKVERMSVAAKLQDRSGGNLLSYAGSLGLTATAFPWLEFSITGNHQMSADSSESMLTAVHGRDRKTLNIKHIMNKRGSLKEEFEGNMQTSVSYAQVLDFTSVVKHMHSANEIACSAEVTYGGSKTGRISWNLANKLQETGKMSGSMAVQCPAIQLLVSTELSKLADGEYSHTFAVEAGKEKPFEMANVYKMSPAGDYQISGSLNVPSLTGAVSYSSQIRAKADDFLAKAELSKAADTYSMEATYRMPGKLSALGSARLVTPKSQCSAKFAVDVGGTHKTVSVELSSSGGKPMTVTLAGEYNNVDTDVLVSRDSSVTLALPGTRMQLSGNVRIADRRNLASELELTVNDKRSKLSMEYDEAATARARLHLESPYIRYNGVSYVDLELVNSGHVRAFTNYVGISWAPERKVTVDTKLDLDATSWSTDVKTPFASAATFGSSLSFNTDVSDLRIQGKAYVNDKEVSSVASLRGTESGSITATLPDRTSVSAAFEHSIVGGKLKNKIELSWGQRQQLILDTNVGFRPDVVGTVSLSTPFPALQSVVVSVDHQGKSYESFSSTASVTWDGKRVQVQAKNGEGQASTSVVTPWNTVSADCTYSGSSSSSNGARSARGSLSWSPNKTVTWSASLDRSAGIAASVGFTSPFERLRSVEARLTHSGSALNFDTSAEVVWEQTNRIAVQGKLTTRPSIEGSFSVATPFAVLPSAKVAFIHSGSQLSFSNQATLDYSSYEQMKFESKYSQASGGSMTIRGIPSDKLKSAEVGCTYSAKKERISVTTIVTWNGSQKVTVSAERTRSRQNTQTATLSVTTPFSALTSATAKITHSGGLLAFTNQAELSWGEGRKVGVITEFNQQASSAKLEVSSPYGGMKVLHSGALRQFTSSASLTASDSKVLASVQAELSSQSGIYGKISVVTPLEKAKSLSATFTHKGQWSDFESNAEVSWAEGMSASTNARFKYGDAVSGELRAVCPWSAGSMKFNHEGSLSSFRSSAEVAWGKRDNFAVTARFSSADAISGEVGLKSTLRNLETVNLTFEHTGVPSSFSNRGRLTWANNGEISFSSRLDVSSTVSVEMELSTPVANAKFSHNGNLARFVNNAEIMWSTNNKVAFDSSFSMANDVTLAVTFRSPFKHVEELGLRASHRRDTATTFADYAEFSWAAGKKMSLDTRVDRTSGLTATATFSHPSINMGAFLNHSGNLRSFNSNAGLSWASDKKVEASIEFSNGSSITGKATLASPFEKLRNVEASFNFRNLRDGLQAEASTAWSQTEKVTARFTFANLPALSVDFAMQSPWSTLSAVARHTGGWSNFANSAEVSWGSDKRLTYSSRFSAASDVSLSARLSSPFGGLESLSVSALHKRIAQKFTTYGDFSWAEGQKVSLDTAVDFDSGFVLTGKFASPFENVDLSISHTGDLQSFNCRADLTWSGDQRMAGSIEFQNGTTVSGKVTFSSPFESLRSAEGSFNHQKGDNGFETSGSMMWSPSQRVNTRVTYQGLPALRMTASLNSPFADISGSAEHSGTWPDFSNKAEISWSADKTVAVSSRFATAPEVSMAATFSSPFNTVEALSFTASHRGQLTGTFSNSAELSWAAGKTMSLTTSVDRSTGIIATTRFASPFQNIDASLNHVGTRSFFKSKAEIGWGSSERIAASLDFDNRSTLSVDAKFTSPFEAVKNLAATFNHKKVGNGYETDASVSLLQQTASGRITFQGLPDLKMTAAFNSPLADINASAEHSGTWLDFSNKAEISWSADKKIAVSSRFAKAPEVSMAATFSSPFNTLEAMSFTASHRGQLTGTFSNSAEFSWAAGKTVSLTTSVDRSSGIKASTRFASPFQNVDASISHTGDVRSFQCVASLAWSPSSTIKMTAEFSQVRDVSGKVTFSSPFRHMEDVKAEFTHNGGFSTGFNCRASLDLAPGKTIAITLLYTGGNEYKYLATLNTPFGLRTAMVSAAAKQTESSCDGSVELKWNNNSFKVSSSYEAPKAGDVSGQVEVTANNDVYRIAVMGSKVDGSMQAKIAVVTPFASYEESKLEGSASLADNRFTLSMQGQLGNSDTLSRVNLVLENAASNGRASIEVITPLLEKPQKVELAYSAPTNEVTLTADVDVTRIVSKLSVSASRTTSQGMHTGNLVVAYEWNGVKDTARLQGSYGKVRSQYRSTFSAQRDSEPSNKLSWASSVSTSAKVIDVDFTLKTPFDVANDARFTFKLTGDSREFSISTSARLRPESTVEVVLQFSRRVGLRINAEFRSPFEALRSAAAIIKAQNSPTDNTLNVLASYNGQESKLDGSFKANGNDDFDGSLEFTSPMEGFRSIKMQVSCKKVDGVLRPYATISWAADKRVDISASFRHDSNSREATLDISTPFSTLSSLHAEFAHVAHLPDTVNSRFEFKTNGMTEKLSAGISYDRSAGSASLLVSSPWQAVRSVQLTANFADAKIIRLDMNGNMLASVTTSWNISSIRNHNGEITMDIPAWSKYLRLKVSNALESSTAELKSSAELEYSRGKVVSLNYSNRRSSGLISLTLDSPFPSATFSYNLKYTGSRPDDWTEETRFTSSLLQFTSSSQLKFQDGLRVQHSCQLTYNGQTYTTSKTFTAAGDRSRFTASFTCRSSYMPSVDAELTWAASPMAIKTTVNGYAYELAASGSQASIKAEFPYQNKKESVAATANWQKEGETKITLTTPFQTMRNFEASVSANGATIVSAMTYNGLKAVTYVGSFSSSGSALTTRGEVTLDEGKPISWNGQLSLGEGSQEAQWTSSVFGVNVNANIKPFESKAEVRNGQGAGASIELSNALNADGERVPLLTVTTYDTNGSSKTYAVRGLYKNVGSGVVRDFKLHLQTPRELGHSLDLKFEFSIKSNQFVPGDAIVHCFVTKPDGTVQQLVQLNAEWGNSGITAVIRDPWPMKYEMKFNVNTRRQAVEVIANWNTARDDSSVRIDFSRAGAMNSQIVQEKTEARIIYGGSSYAVTSELDWQRTEASHKLKLDISDTLFGYEARYSKLSGKPLVANVKIITPLRSVLLENSMELDTPKTLGMTSYLSWDADRDVSKRVGGMHVIRWESNKLWMDTTFHHPALSRDVRIVDEIVYNTDGVIGSFKKTVDYSQDEQKKIVLSARLTTEDAAFVLTQPSNNINIDVSGNLRASQETYAAGGKLIYMTSDGVNKAFELTGSLDVRAMVASLRATSPEGTTSVRGELMSRPAADSSAYTVIVRGNRGSGSPVTATVDMNGRTLTTSVTVDYDGGQLALSAGRFNATAYSIEMSHLENGVRHTDGVAAVSLNPDNIVNGRLYWNPENYVAIKSKVEQIRNYLKESVKTLAEGVSTEFNSRRSPQDAEVTAVMDYSRREVELIGKDAAVAINKVNDLYERDALYVRSAGESVSRNAARVHGKMLMLREKYNTMATAVAALYTSEVAPVMASVSTEVGVYWQKIQAELADIEELLSRVADGVGNQLIENSLAVSEKAVKIGRFLKEFIDYAASEASKHESLAFVRDFHARAMTTFNTYSDAVSSRVSDATAAISARIAVQPERASRLFGETYDFANARSAGYLEGIVDRQTFASFGEAGVERIKSIYSNLNVERHVSQFVAHAKELAREYLNSVLTSSIDKTIDGAKWLSYDPDTGSYQFDLRIPSVQSDMNVDDVKLAVRSRLSNAVAVVSSYVPELKMPSFRLRAPRLTGMLPPYDAYATISGQHIQTFDRRHYDFIGSCSYLLARDFEDGNFSLTIKYDSQGAFSISAVDDGKTIELMSDGSVRVEGGKVELPVERANTTVTKEDEKVKLINARGVAVTCQWGAGYCTVQMSGWYFAKTAGLLGTYNNEGSDDFTTSDNRNVSDVLEFTSSWKLSSSCQNVNSASAAVSVPKICHSMFESSDSALSPCFSVIDPNMYTHMCADAAAQNRRNPHCSAVQLYKEICSREGVQIYAPTECTSCAMPNKVVRNGESARITNAPSTADVVFVIEERDCNDYLSSKMPFLVAEMEDAFSKKGLKDNRYGIVGFGGEGVHELAHTHTFDGQTMTTVDRFRQGADALQFSAKATEQDALSAIRYAAGYRFRAGAAKVIVLLSCSNCSKGDEEYDGVRDLLRSMDITFHAVMEHNFDLVNQEKKAQTSALFGVDHASVYTIRDAKTFKGDKTQYGSLRFPSNQCFSLALQSKGSFFDLRMLKEKPQVAKNFQRVLAVRVAATAEPGDCQVCTCRADDVRGPFAVCSQC